MAHHQFRADFLCPAVTEVDHFVVVVTGIDMHERERQHGLAIGAEAKRLQCQMQHDHRILATRKQQCRLAAFSDQFAQDVNRFGFEPVEVIHPVCRVGKRCVDSGIERRAHVLHPSLIRAASVGSRHVGILSESATALRPKRFPC